MEALAAGAARAVLRWLSQGLGSLAAWLWSKAREANEVRKEKKEVSEEVKRVREAIDKAFDGNPITPEEKKELVNSFRELIRDY